MFELIKKNASVPATDIDEGGTFEYDGEVYLRIEVPEEMKIGGGNVKLGDGEALCVSLETFRMIILTRNNEVYRMAVTAEAGIHYGD